MTAAATQHDVFDHDEGVSEVVESTELMALNKSEIDIQITTAKRYPRSIRTFRQEALEMATLDEETAGECMYALKRKDKTIEGPSARFAEIVGSAWGNCRVSARTIGDDGKFVTAQGGFFDLQRNYAIAYEVKRRITDKWGKRYSDDMVGVTANAACSIALRNAVLKGVPKAFWKAVYQQARRTAIGDASTLSAKRDAMLTYFGKMGVTPERVFGVVGKADVESISLDDLAILKGIATAIKEGETSVDEAFADRSEPAGNGGGAADVNAKLAAARANAKATEGPAAPTSAASTTPPVEPAASTDGGGGLSPFDRLAERLANKCDCAITEAQKVLTSWCKAKAIDTGRIDFAAEQSLGGMIDNGTIVAKGK